MKLEDRQKQHENKYRIYIPKEEYIVIRIDGHKFSKYTKAFKKPFDSILSKCMIETTKELMRRTNAVTGYTQSDEITLILKPSFKDDVNNQIHAGRIDKIVSLVASYATQVFNKTMFELLDYTKEQPNMKSRFLTATFDARAFGVDSIEAFNSILWRMRDAEKNSKSMFAMAYCSHKSLLNKNAQEQIDFCLKTTGKNWNDIDECYKYGILIKKERYSKITTFERNGLSETVKAKRTRLAEFSEKLSFSDANVDFICRKFK
jgi:tRNA(His) 5'-end guanylyltransferase